MKSILYIFTIVLIPSVFLQSIMTSELSNFDLSSFPITSPSICIPRAFANISKPRILAIFANLNFGTIEQIDIVHKTNAKGEKFQRVFIHFLSWNQSNEIDQVRQLLFAKKSVRIVYDDPWYWELSASTSVRPENRPTRLQRPLPFVQFNTSSHNTPTTESLTLGC